MTERRPDDGQTGWVDIPTAAAHLGTTSDAVKQRIKRKSLYAIKQDRRWYVALDRLVKQQDATEQPTQQRPDADRSPDQTRHGAMVDQLRQENGRLRDEQDRLWRQLGVKDQQLAEKDDQLRAWADQAQQQRLMIARLESQLLELPAGAPESPERHGDQRDEGRTMASPIARLRPRGSPGGDDGGADEPPMRKLSPVCQQRTGAGELGPCRAADASATWPWSRRAQGI